MVLGHYTSFTQLRDAAVDLAMWSFKECKLIVWELEDWDPEFIRIPWRKSPERWRESGMAAKNRSWSHGGWEGQLIIDVILLGPMATNPFPVLWKCFDKLKRSKMTRIKSKYDNINKDSHMIVLNFFVFLMN